MPKGRGTYGSNVGRPKKKKPKKRRGKKQMPRKRDPRLKRAGVKGFNKPKRTPIHPKK